MSKHSILATALLAILTALAFTACDYLTPVIPDFELPEEEVTAIPSSLLDTTLTRVDNLPVFIGSLPGSYQTIIITRGDAEGEYELSPAQNNGAESIRMEAFTGGTYILDPVTNARTLTVNEDDMTIAITLDNESVITYGPEN